MMGRRDRYGWGSTNETAFAMIALTDLIQMEQTGARLELSINIQGEQIIDLVIPEGEPNSEVLIPLADFAPGEYQITVSGGQGQLYYLLTTETVTERSPEEDGIRIRRSFLDPATKKPLSEVQVGDLLLIRLEITLKDERFYLLLEDPLPGGLVALNESLALTSHEETLGEIKSTVSYRYKDLGYNHKQVYRDRVVFFATEWRRGTHTIEYLARATVAGEFTVLPANLTTMYDSSFYGYSEVTNFEISE